jgi:hypothetical protein
MKTAEDFKHKRIAKIDSTMLGFEDHGILTAMLYVSYGGSAQGVGGYVLDYWSEPDKRRMAHALCGQFILGVLRATGASKWEAVKGRTLFVLLDSDAFQATAIGLAPLPTESGEVFLFDELKKP